MTTKPKSETEPVRDPDEETPEGEDAQPGEGEHEDEQDTPSGLTTPGPILTAIEHVQDVLAWIDNEIQAGDDKIAFHGQSLNRALDILFALGTPGTAEPPPGFVPCMACEGAGILPLDLKHDPNTETCPECSGFGQVVTGSRGEQTALRICTRCQGAGYVDTAALEPLPQPLPLRDPSEPAPPVALEAGMTIEQARAAGYIIVAPAEPLPASAG